MSHARRPSSSWLRRISVVPNQPDSRVATPSPLSPCFNRPASPAASRPSSQRRPPNKLVKRPPSEQSNAHPSLPGVTSPTFRRPATSYQRTGTRHRATHSLNFEPSFIANASVQSPTPEIPESASDGGPWRPYLMSTIDGLHERLARKLSTAASPRDHGILRRILPSESAAPALVLATSITDKQPTTTEATLDQCTTPTTPATPATPASPPVQFRDPFTSIDASTERPETSCPPERRSRQPSVSFDEADPRAHVESSTVTDAGRPRGSSLTYAKRRAVSTPLPKLERTNPEALFPHGKRNVTDPAVFGRVPTGIKGSRQSIVPASVSRDFRAEMGALGDTVHRPLTSDPLALSSLQNGSSRQFDSNSSIRQRPRRHSVAASDPASTVIGSDDTRVFTSGDEDETDFLSDTAFDSIRTHLTTSSKSNPHGPRIETIFDNESPEHLPNEGLVKLEDLVHRGTFVSRPPNTDPCVPVSNSSRIPQDIRDTRDSDSARLSLISDFTDDDVRSLVAGLPGEPNGPLLPSNRLASPGREDGLYSLDSFRTRNVFEMRNSESLYETENPNASKETLDSLPKMNIFDWSEKPNDREVPGSDPRPRTVHGKQGAEIRGSRAPGRKAPTTLHLRSQSVPVSRDPSLSSESRQSSGKFGT